MNPAPPRLLPPVLGLALAAAVSLGLARFAHALRLPPMRADLGWTCVTAGAAALPALGAGVARLQLPLPQA